MLWSDFQRIASDDKPDTLNRVQEEVDELKGIMVRNIGKTDSMLIHLLCPYFTIFTHRKTHGIVSCHPLTGHNISSCAMFFCLLKLKIRYTINNIIWSNFKTTFFLFIKTSEQKAVLIEVVYLVSEITVIILRCMFEYLECLFLCRSNSRKRWKARTSCWQNRRS